MFCPCLKTPNLSRVALWFHILHMLLFSLVNTEAKLELQKQCEKLIHSDLQHLEVLKRWKDLISMFKHSESETNVCKPKVPYKGDLFFQQIDDLKTDFSLSGIHTENDVLTGFGTIFFHDSSLICVRGHCEESQLYKSASTLKNLQDPIISITGTFCSGVLEGKAGIIYNTGLLILANFRAGVLEGFVSEFRGGSVVGVQDVRGGRRSGVSWQFEGRSGGKYDRYKKYHPSTNTGNMPKLFDSYLVRDGPEAVLFINEQEGLTVFSGKMVGKDGEIDDDVLDKVKKVELIGWECRENFLFPRIKHIDGEINLDASTLGVMDVDDLLYKSTKIINQRHSLLRMNKKITQPYETSSKSSQSFPPVALVSFPGSGNSWVRILLQYATGLYTSVELGSVNFKEGGLVIRSHHFPQHPYHQVGPLQRKHQTFYDDVIHPCRDKLGEVQSGEMWEVLLSCAGSLKPDMVEEVGEGAKEMYRGLKIEQDEVGHSGEAGMVAKNRLEHVGAFGGRGILLLRNPFTAILSWWWHYNYGDHSGSSYMPDVDLDVNSLYTDRFCRFVIRHIKRWRQLAVDWLLVGDILVIHYEHVKRDQVKQLKKILQYLNVKPIDKNMNNIELDVFGVNVGMMVKHDKGCSKDFLATYQRKKKPKITKNPFTPEMTRKIKEAIHDVNELLKYFGHSLLPVEYYEYYLL